MLLNLDSGARSALLIVDMQPFFFRQPERRALLEGPAANINRLIAAFDALDWPVVHCITALQPDGSDWDLKMKASGVPELISGSPEAAILPEICATDRHWVVQKTRYSAFFKTNLSKRLNAQAVRRVVVTGAYTHYCVNATVFDAYCCDFVPGIATDAVISHLEEESQVMVARMVRNGYHVFSTDEYLQLLGERS
ncbi:MAG TPA: cysteine hydrolase [Anaerolineaceae bacterium]|nr:cysteine hydrolase [Anaerolineaceae bacterium]